MSMVFYKVFIFFPFSYTEPARRSCPDSRVISSIAFTSFSVVSRIFGAPNMPETMAAPAAPVPLPGTGAKNNLNTFGLMQKPILSVLLLKILFLTIWKKLNL